MQPMSAGSRYPRRGLVPAVTGLAAAVSLLGALIAPPALAAPTAGAPGSAAASYRGGLVAVTQDGKLRGKHAEGIDQFLGVPYAAPRPTATAARSWPAATAPGRTPRTACS
jgi:hypothetical protein